MKSARAAFAVVLFLLIGVVPADARKRDHTHDAEGLRIYEVPTDAMAPTIRAGDKILVNERAYMLDQPGRGDVIVYRSPVDGQATLVKRIIGLPGETIEIQHKKVTIDGRELVEAYVVHSDPVDYTGTDSPNRTRDSFGPITLKAGEYFVLGDNRDASIDSRQHGPVVLGLIHAKVIRVRRGETIKEVK